MLSLVTSDGQEFELCEAAAMESGLLKTLVEEFPHCRIPLPNVSSKVMPTVKEYLERRVFREEEQQLGDEFRAWGSDLLKNTDAIEVLKAAAYLDVPKLQDLAAKAVAASLDGMNVNEIRRALGVVASDFSDEEEAAIQRQSAWAQSRQPLFDRMLSVTWKEVMDEFNKH